MYENGDNEENKDVFPALEETKRTKRKNIDTVNKDAEPKPKKAQVGSKSTPLYNSTIIWRRTMIW